MKEEVDTSGYDAAGGMNNYWLVKLHLLVNNLLTFFLHCRYRIRCHSV